MKFRFFGGADEVGGLAVMLEDGFGKVMFDYGLIPRDPPVYPLQAPPVDEIVLTHAHVDHSGMIPWLTSRYPVPVHGTMPTKDVGRLLMLDSIKVAKMEGFPEPYDPGDVDDAMKLFQVERFGHAFEIGGTEFIPRMAGHIPGAAMHEIRADRNVLFTGDIHTAETRLVQGAEEVKTDIMVVESTYAGREHPDRKKTEAELIDKVNDIVGRGGQAILPAFAVGRTQELLMILGKTGLNIWVDGMGRKVNSIYNRSKDYVSSATELRKACVSAFEVQTNEDRYHSDRADVIVTTSGMLDGGPALSYIERIKNDPKSGILISGFQVEESNGYRLLSTGQLEINGVLEKINCEVSRFDLSAHAGHSEIVSFVNRCDPETVILVHGDGDKRKMLADEFDGRKVFMPKKGESLEL
ncbi:MAG: MBL fold metallo-hydrolase [Thermoplasmata archaeon]|uniref:MBL fold metallo-hydrolase n=1 Tax=Candidatus Sysuiplasma superficiale TaxID=2823368 RepID=A0A8J7YUI1_9ARCH|nr:MBL fold metallo-hydrolase [Candidatus Sysuiplasma acidicola]MBX8644924.1 MBL fold metallo-hydrolase [Candidatus Sysuiplasma superficiale]MBX8646548.1 MBL fold metallo-hydrolase [Candidatus Sysuiplasma acidicola]MDH2906381.1 MBL fold metallo-hydrolase [Methanomassiliicoccales archaeon]